MESRELGALGEDFTENFFKKKGYLVLARNFHASGGELDLVVRDPRKNIYLVIEVKTRKNKDFDDGISAVDERKLAKIESAATDFFLKKLNFTNIPDYEIHVVALTVRPPKNFWEKQQKTVFFEMEYYDDLG